MRRNTDGTYDLPNGWTGRRCGSQGSSFNWSLTKTVTDEFGFTEVKTLRARTLEDARETAQQEGEQ